jgi:Protein of unknown function (DUF732)
MKFGLELCSFITVTVAAAAVIVAPTAGADPASITSNDNDFIRLMAQEGVTGSPSDMISEGHWICTNLIQGDSASDLDSQIKSKNPRFSQEQVNALVGFAVGEYCEGESGRLDS